MEWYFIVVLVLCILFLLSLIPLKVNFRTYWDILGNLGVVSITIFRVPVYVFQVQITKNAINIIKSKGKEKSVPLSQLHHNAVFTHLFLVAVFRYLVISEVSIFVQSGKKNDATTTALVNGFLLQALYAFYAILSTKKPSFKSYMSVDNVLDKNKFSFSGFIGVWCAPIVLLLSAARAVIRIKRMVNYYERVWQR